MAPSGSIRSHLIPLALLSLTAHAQTPNPSPSNPQPPLHFEVASIRPHPSAAGEPSNRRILPGGRFVASATSVATLLRIAFATDEPKLAGTPTWVHDENFDIDATVADHIEVSNPQQFQQLILSLLEDRFQLKYHRAQTDAPIFWLELNKTGKLGPAIQPSAPDQKPNLSTHSNGVTSELKASKTSMADLAAALRRQSGRPIEDHTNLPGLYDLHLEWSPSDTPDATNPSLFTALKDQLGLKPQPAKGTDVLIVVEQITHPSPN